MQIRGYRPGDYEAMHRLHLQCFPRSTFDLDAIRKFAEAKRAIVAIADGNGPKDIVGFVVLDMYESSAHDYSNVCILGKHARFSHFTMLPECGSDDLAASMLTHAEEQASAAGALSVVVETPDTNSAIKFYSRQKYLQFVREEEYFNACREDGLVFIKSL